MGLRRGLTFFALWCGGNILLGEQVYRLMVDTPWGLKAQGDFTVESNFAAYLFVAIITAAAAWAITRRPDRATLNP